MVENKHRILEGRQKRTLLGGPREREPRKAFQKALKSTTKVVFALANQQKAGKDFIQL